MLFPFTLQSSVELKHNTSLASYIFRYQNEGICSIAERIKADWTPPTVAGIHWDSKIMNSLSSKYNYDDRLPVLLSGNGGVKLLGVPQIPVKSGQGQMGSLIAEASMNLLQKWDCPPGNLCSMVFDTTASNTGHKTAACIALQQATGRALLWTACRHHVGEVILTHVWDCLKIETSSGPDILLFKRFQKNFQKLSVDNFTNLAFDVIVSQEDNTNTIALLHNLLIQDQVRDDYKELLELSLIYLTGSSEILNRFCFKQPGALHKARWLSKILYSMKIVLLQDKISSELPQEEVFSERNSEQQIAKLIRFVRFVVLVYVKWWFTWPIAAQAPFRDLQLLKDIDSYKVVDLVVAQTSLKAFSNHLWYLAEDLVPLALFSDVVPEEERQSIANAMKAIANIGHHTNRMGTGFGKPVFPKIKSLDLSCAKLSDFIGADSWLFFELLKINTEFLHQPLSSWDRLESYCNGLSSVRVLKVVNDAAERGVKLASDFLPKAKVEEKYQNVLQVVENDRHSRPNQRHLHSSSAKRFALEEPTWFLKL
jgi:hypothetical protein